MDDGSTDGSGEILRRLASAHRHVLVHGQENSGWPGKPRNVGIDLARGEYIQFVDQDDELGPEALERMYELGRSNHADIVLGKIVGTMLGPRRIYRQTVQRGTVAESGVTETLTGHKMFRRAFLLEHGIRFPEGYWRGEDLLFVTRAYAHADVVSILADYPCYYWNARDDGGNNSRAAFDLDGHYERLRFMIDEVYALTEPGPRQDALLRRMYRVGVMTGVTGHAVLSRNAGRLAEALPLAQAVAKECFPPRTRESLSPVVRLQAALLENGDLDASQELARRLDEVRPHAVFGRVEWRDKRLHVPTELTLRRGDEDITVVKRDGRYLLDPALVAGLPGGQDVVVEDPLADSFADPLVRVKDGNVWWFGDSDVSPHLEDLGGDRYRVVLRGHAIIDPSRVAGGRSLDVGRHGLSMDVRMLGIGRRLAVLPASRLIPRRPVVVGVPPTMVDVRGGTSPRRSRRVHLRVRNLAQELATAMSLTRVTRSSLRPARGPIRIPVTLAKVRLPRRVALPVDGVTAALSTCGRSPSSPCHEPRPCHRADTSTSGSSVRCCPSWW